MVGALALIINCPADLLLIVYRDLSSGLFNKKIWLVSRISGSEIGFSVSVAGSSAVFWVALLTVSEATGSAGTSGAATTGASVSTGGVFVERTP